MADHSEERTQPERWLPISAILTRYEVSDHGRVRKLSSAGEAKLLEQTENWQGYQRVRIYFQGRNLRFSVHRLVGAAFWGFDSPVVRHRDDDPGNNFLGNLEPGTQSDNILDAVKRGRHANAKKTHCKHGHEFTDENTHRDKNNYRYCRTCLRRRLVASRGKKKEGISG